MATKYRKAQVEDYLNETDYQMIGYMPSDEALLFVNFIKEVNNGAEENETPLVHLKMMDNVFNDDKRCAILCHRGIGKTTVFAEYLFLFIAAFGYMPGFGKVSLILYVTDSVENGVKNLRRNVEFRYANSEFLQKLIPNRKITVGTNDAGFVDVDEYEKQSAGGRKFTDVRLEFKNHKGHTTIIKGYGAQALTLDSLLYTIDGITTIGKCKIGDKIFGADGKLANIIDKSVVFNKPVYEITLDDNRTIKVTDDHINSIVYKENINNTANYTKMNRTTKELLDMSIVHTRVRKRKNKPTYTSNENRMFIENCKPLELDEQQFILDPYTLGLLLGDGSMKKDGGSTLHTHKDDLPHYLEHIPYELGSCYVDKRNTNVCSQYIKGLTTIVKELKVNVHGNIKFIPEQYLIGSIEQRLAILQGLMDTDGTISKNGRCSFSSNSIYLTQGVCSLVRSLGGTAKPRYASDRIWVTEIWIDYNPFRLQRKRSRYIKREKQLVAIKSIVKVSPEPSQCIAIDNEEHQFITTGYVRTHNTGVRGAKEMGQRPMLAILDDLVSDSDANSPTIIATIENTVYKAVSKALSPTRQKMVWLGTPFNARDPLYKAVESGAWRVSVYPICEEFPVTEEDFKGSWEDRFTYEYVKDEYDEAQALGMPANFDQELMLRIMSDEDRLIADEDIVWYKRSNVLDNMGNFNYYITTDLAVSSKAGADYGVISVWAINNNGDYLWVDGTLKRQKLSKHLDDLFRLVRIYKKPHGYIEVGIELDGQQMGFLDYIRERMMTSNTYFTLAKEKGKTYEGIRAAGNGNKHSRFKTMQPKFALKKVRFPEELKDSAIMLEAVAELKGVSNTSFKAKHDDFLDTVTQLNYIDIIVPSENTNTIMEHIDGVWYEHDIDDMDNGGSSVVF